MGEGYVIPLNVSIKQMFKDIDDAGDKLKELGRISKDTQEQLRMVRGGRMGGGSGGSGGGRGGGSNPWDQRDFLDSLNGPYPSQNAEKMAALRRIRAQQSVDRAERALNPPDPMKTMFMRTRLKIGPWQPLVGDLVKNGLLDEGKIDAMMARIGGSAGGKSAVARLAGAAMPLVLGGAVATAAVAGSVALMEGFASSQRQLSSAYWVGGGGRNLGAAVGIGGFAGMSPGDTAQMANQFGDRLRSGGIGSAWMRSNGVIDLGRYTLNKFDNLVKAMDLLRKTDERTAIMVARDLGMSDMLSIRDLSDGTYQRLKNSAAIGSSPQARRDEAEYRANKEIIGNWWDAGVRSAGGATAGRLVNPWRWSPVGETVDSFQKAYDKIREWTTGKKPDDQASATEELTGAIKGLTRTFKDHAETLGGGARTKGTLPVGIRGLQLEQTLNSQSQIFGAFSV